MACGLHLFPALPNAALAKRFSGTFLVKTRGYSNEYDRDSRSKELSDLDGLVDWSVGGAASRAGGQLNAVALAQLVAYRRCVLGNRSPGMGELLWQKNSEARATAIGRAG
jgi:hypothetical protein